MLAAMSKYVRILGDGKEPSKKPMKMKIYKPTSQLFLTFLYIMGGMLWVP